LRDRIEPVTRARGPGPHQGRPPPDSEHPHDLGQAIPSTRNTSFAVAEACLSVLAHQNARGSGRAAGQTNWL